jgi:hypothetical protein
MDILVCLDDTDNLESRGTGELASLLAEQIEQQGWGRSSFVTRHQLLVHPDIPYTSHNSAMCFSAVLEDGQLDHFIDYAARFLERESAPGSDPGLCVAVPTMLADTEALIAFGRSAKQEVLAKKAAYALAKTLGVHLSEHGGSGQGVVGALAGTGLRLGGNDGRLRGKLEVGSAGEKVAVRALIAHPLIDEVRCANGASPGDDDLVILEDRKVKTVLLDGKSVLLLAPADGGVDGTLWRTFSRRELKNF